MILSVPAERYETAQKHSRGLGACFQKEKSAGFSIGAFALNELSLSEPLVSLGSGHALDAGLSVLGLGAAAGIQEELAALSLVQGLFVAGRIAEIADGALGNQLGSFGIVFNLADDLLHGDEFLSYSDVIRAGYRP